MPDLTGNFGRLIMRYLDGVASSALAIAALVMILEVVSL